MVPSEAALRPRWAKIWRAKSATDVLPLVPVTATMGSGWVGAPLDQTYVLRAIRAESRGRFLLCLLLCRGRGVKRAGLAGGLRRAVDGRHGVLEWASARSGCGQVSCAPGTRAAEPLDRRL